MKNTDSEVTVGSTIKFFPENGFAMQHWSEKAGKVTGTFFNDAGRLVAARVEAAEINFNSYPYREKIKPQTISAESIIGLT